LGESIGEKKMSLGKVGGVFDGKMKRDVKGG